MFYTDEPLSDIGKPMSKIAFALFLIKISTSRTNSLLSHTLYKNHGLGF